MIHVTAHAVDRYRERINPILTPDQAKAVIQSHAIAVKAAADFGCRVVRTGNGAKPILDGTTVVTVIARHQLERRLAA